MKTLTTGLLTLMLIGSSFGAAAQDAAEVVTTSARQPARKVPYVPTAENLAAREKFADAGFGIFIHWGIYSMFAQGEWYLQNCGMSAKEYAKAADGFYPAKFNAAEWVSAIKDAGARYITITSRHHDDLLCTRSDMVLRSISIIPISTGPARITPPAEQVSRRERILPRPTGLTTISL